MGKFIGIDEILQGGTPNRPTHSTPKEGKKGEALARTSLEYPLELHRKVKKYAVDAGMKEKQVIAQAIYNPQNEMFRLWGTKRSFSQNETFFFSHP